MTRPTPSQSELLLGQALVSYLAQSGRTVSDVEFGDRPDLRFSLDGERVACEFTQIPPQSVMRFVDVRFRQLENKGASAVRVVWPIEHDVWMRDAVNSKQRKIDAYRRNANVQSVYLLVHAPTQQVRDLLGSRNPIVLGLLRAGCNAQKHGFSKVFFWSKETGIASLFPNELNEPLNYLKPSATYPTHSYVLYTGMTFKTTGLGEAPVTYDYGLIRPEVILVPPLTPELRSRRPNFSNPGMRVKFVANHEGGQLFYDPVEEDSLPHKDGDA